MTQTSRATPVTPAPYPDTAANASNGASIKPAASDPILLSLPNPPGTGVQLAMRQATASEMAWFVAHVTKSDVAVRASDARSNIDLPEGTAEQWLGQIAQTFGLTYVCEAKWNVLAPETTAAHWRDVARTPIRASRSVALDLVDTHAEAVVQMLTPFVPAKRTGSASGTLAIQTLSRPAADVLRTVCGLDTCSISKTGALQFETLDPPPADAFSISHEDTHRPALSDVPIERVQVRGVALLKDRAYALITADMVRRVVGPRDLIGTRPIVSILARGVELGPLHTGPGDQQY